MSALQETTYIEEDADSTWSLGQFSIIQSRMLLPESMTGTNSSEMLEHLDPDKVLELLGICYPFRAEDVKQMTIRLISFDLGSQQLRVLDSQGPELSYKHKTF
ncbi:hypothetical protein OCU04_010912 [Sclerotinia nivalis]|uniref:Uncharacterized protein n=1 Tax=Sclerotinia nivalis TaxID=352851 RepID=A0A9X0DEI4_9HELO|nr:hypothetical protein OCU04_010912 [Sclerotinia nivalis]